ncbi:MAG: vWA domain-containing protein, partial [Clostridium sp.]
MLNIAKKIIGILVIVVILGSIWAKAADSNLSLPLNLSKTATKTGDREFKIDLEVNGEGYENKKGIDIIIVMDSSGSMANNPMVVLKNAVKNFSNEMLSRGDTRISIINFNGSTNLNSSGNANDAKIITAGLNGFENSITNINTVVDSVEAEGSTNTQAAIRRINSQLVESKRSKPNSSRYVVFFTDGLPTTAIGKEVVEEKNEAKVNSYILETQKEYNNINKAGVKFISIGLFRNITDESLRWQENAANDLLNGIQNSGKYMINTEAEIEAIYDKIKQEIIKSNSIAKNVTL